MTTQLKKKLSETMPQLGEIYAQQGFFSPVSAISETEAKELRQDYEAAERELHGDTDRLALLKAYPNRLLPSFDAATRNRNLVTAAQEILGENILVWSAALFIKEADSTKIVSWHQDLTYWQLNDIKEVTCWLAVSSARKEAGCMKFIPGSHKDKIVPHNDTFDENNIPVPEIYDVVHSTGYLLEEDLGDNTLAPDDTNLLPAARYWVIPHVGVVKYEYFPTTDQPVTYELISYQL